MKRFKPTLWLSFGLMSLTVALALTGYVLGLMPDGFRAELDSRAKVAEALAVQLAGAASRKDQTTLEETINSVVKRNPDVLSAALRRQDGSLYYSSGNHEENWTPVEDNKSTPTHVSVPMFGANGPQGAIEIYFSEPSAGTRYFGIPASLLLFLTYIATAGFLGYFFLLRRSLKELDPGRVIPERVQKAFDTLNEGVIIIDERQRILLMNEAFLSLFPDDGSVRVGSRMNSLGWRTIDATEQAGIYPWHTALTDGEERRSDSISLRTPTGGIHNFNVNATVINGDDDVVLGAIVTLRDLTQDKQSAQELTVAIKQLKKTEQQVTRQKQELAYLSNHDTLSGCLNRRTFVAQFSPLLEQADHDRTPASVVMVGIGNFKEIVDEHGPSIADRVIIDMAAIVKASCTGDVLVARYNEDSFSIALPDSGDEATKTYAATLRAMIKKQASSMLPKRDQIAFAIGYAQRDSTRCSAHELVHRAARAQSLAAQKSITGALKWSVKTDDGISGSDLSETSGKETEAPFDSDMNDSAPVGDEQGSEIMSQLGAMSRKQLVQMAADNISSDFHTAVEQTVERCRKQRQQFSILRLSVTSWIYLTEALGQANSQRLMREVVRKIESTLRETDDLLLVGDSGEVLIKIEELEDAEDVSWIIRRMLDVLRQPFEVNGREMHIACKIGVALYPEHGADAQTLCRNAGIALHRALEDPLLDGSRIFDPQMINSSNERLIIESGIREALHKDEFELFFQPMVCAQTGKLTGAEALLRCRSAAIGHVRMDQLIEIAEKSSLSAEIDIWVVRTAIAQMHTWCDIGLELPKVSINLSANQLSDERFMEGVYDRIKKVRFSPSRIQIEVTETARIANVDLAAPHLKRLQQLGVLIALDDFGTGQASLAHLQRLHPDVVKIDRSFITNVDTNHANATMVGAVIVMSHCLGLKVVAEGVETERELAFLRESTCDDIQGYFISKPMPVSVMTDWLGRYVSENGVAAYVSGIGTDTKKDTSSDRRAAQLEAAA